MPWLVYPPCWDEPMFDGEAGFKLHRAFVEDAIPGFQLFLSMAGRVP